MSTLRPPSVLIDGEEEDLPGLSPVPSPSSSLHHETKSLNSSFSESSEADMLASIDASLSLFQLTPSPPIDFTTIPSSTRTPVISLLYRLLSDHTHHDKSLSSLRVTLETIQREMGHLQMRYDDAKEEVKEAEKKLWETEMRRRGLERDSLENEKKLKSEITRLTTKCRMIQSRDNQYRHELRKRELEYEKLQDRLTKLMQDRSKENTKWGMEVLNQTKIGTTNGMNTALMTSQKINRGRGVEGKKTDNIDLITQQHLSNEERMQEIVAENQQLRESFRQLYAKVETAIDSLPAHTLPQTHASPPSPSTLLPAHFDMPFEFIRSSLESSMEQRVAIIERAHEIAEEQYRLEQEQGTDPEILEKWKKHCAEQSSIIQHQDTLLRSSLFADDHFNPLDEDDRRWSAESEEIRHLKAAKTHVNVNAAANNAMAAHTIASTSPKHTRTRSDVVNGTCASLGIDEQDRLSHYHRLLNSGSKKWAQSMLNDMNTNASMSISSTLTPTAATAPPHRTHSLSTNTPSRYTTPKRTSVVHSAYTPYDSIDPYGLSPRTRALLKTPYLSPPPAELSSMSPFLKSYASRDEHEPDAIDETMRHLTEEQSSGTASVPVRTN